MRNRSELERLISGKTELVTKKECELESLRSAFSKQTESFKKEIAELSGKYANVPKPNYGTALFVVELVVLGIVFFVVESGVIPVGLGINLALLALVALAIIAVVVIQIKKRKKLNATYDEERSAIMIEIAENQNKIDEIESKDPRIPQLQCEIDALEEEINHLKKELEEVIYAERKQHIIDLLGTNTLIVAISPYAPGENTAIRKDVLANELSLDGSNRGSIASPFSIYPLSSGFHSVSVDVAVRGIFKDDVLTFRTRDEQFSLKGNNKFYYITPCFFGDEFGKLGTLGVKRFVTDDPFEFLNKIKMSEEEFLEYLESI